MVEFEIHKTIFQKLEKDSLTPEEIIRTIEMIIYLYHVNYYSLAFAIMLIQKFLQKNKEIVIEK